MHGYKYIAEPYNNWKNNLAERLEATLEAKDSRGKLETVEYRALLTREMFSNLVVFLNEKGVLTRDDIEKLFGNAE